MTQEIDKRILGQRIKAIRFDKGMTLEEFGKLFGTSKSIVSRWESGLSSPNPKRLKSIAKIAHMSVSQLLQDQKVFDSRSSPYLQKNLNFLKDIEEVKKIKKDTVVAVEAVEKIIVNLSKYGMIKTDSYAFEMENISNALLDFLSDLERIEKSLEHTEFNKANNT